MLSIEQIKTPSPEKLKTVLSTPSFLFSDKLPKTLEIFHALHHFWKRINCEMISMFVTKRKNQKFENKNANHKTVEPEKLKVSHLNIADIVNSHHNVCIPNKSSFTDSEIPRI